MLTTRALFPIMLVIKSAALVLFGPSDVIASVGDTSVPGNEVAGSITN